MTTAPTHLLNPAVIEMNPTEWRDAVNRALKRLGLTYDELADQARHREFSSIEARKLWVAIGDSES